MTRAEMEDRRFQAKALFAKGLNQNGVSVLLEVSRTTAHRWHKALQLGSDMQRRKATGRPRRMTADQTLTIRAWYFSRLTDRLRTQNRIVAAEIELRFGVKLDVDHVCRITKAWRLERAAP